MSYLMNFVEALTKASSKLREERKRAVILCRQRYQDATHEYEYLPQRQHPLCVVTSLL